MTNFNIKMKIRPGGGALGKQGGALDPAFPLYRKH